MANNKVSNILSVIILVVFSVFVIGCGGGGGGGVTGSLPPVPPAEDAPGTSVLANDNDMFVYKSQPAANIAINIPVNNEAVKFAMVVTNPNLSSQRVRLAPESYVLGKVAPSVRTGSEVQPSDYAQLLLNQAPLESRLRQQARQNFANMNFKANRSLRASDHSGEKVGDIVVMRVVNDTLGLTYISRNCKLERISAHCKIFVDQDSYNGLSAVSGVDAVTAADLLHFENEFETHIYDLMTGSYANFYDIDNDGRISILLSPVYAKLNFAGLFNSNNFADNPNSNLRDLIGLFSPYSAKNWSGERWREATRETICHEMQHLVNYSANYYFNAVNQMEDEWLDESLSVGAEARYRLLRGSPIMENRFSLWANSPSSVGLLNFSRALSQYGMVGLFNFYLYEQSDSATIKAMVNSTQLGIANVNNLFINRDGMNGMFRDWAMAALLDSLRANNQIDISGINAGYRYKTNLGLNVSYTSVAYGYSTSEVYLPAYGAAFYIINQPSGFDGSEYRFRVESESGKNVDILMVRLP